MIKNVCRGVRIALIRFLAICLQRKKKNYYHENALIIAPHPDDEIFGCGCLIQRQLMAGKGVHVIIMSGGEAAHHDCCNLHNEILIEKRKQLTTEAVEILGLPIDCVHRLNYPDGGIAWDHVATDQLKKLLEQLQPDAVYIPHRGEGWSDHLAAGDIIKRLLARQPSTAVFSYCVWFWFYNYWEIAWNNVRLLTMTSKEHKKKLEAIRTYIVPKAPCGTPWSGNLPKVFLWGNEWKRELFFREN